MMTDWGTNNPNDLPQIPSWKGKDGKWHNDRLPTLDDVTPLPSVFPTELDTRLDENRRWLNIYNETKNQLRKANPLKLDSTTEKSVDLVISALEERIAELNLKKED